jgi:hypothetical protein
MSAYTVTSVKDGQLLQNYITADKLNLEADGEFVIFESGNNKSYFTRTSIVSIIHEAPSQRPGVTKTVQGTT